MELEALQETAADIKAQGASLVVISPQLEKYSKLMVESHKLTFPLLRDEDNRLAAQRSVVPAHAGPVCFRPTGEGGQCRSQPRLHPPSGAVGNCGNLEKNGLIK